ncbi:Sporulation related domain-containing protein [Salinihabitans flavidus]|uniref:Sporulation related domain-containing protein n=1 Tax=Salinihabitans flavidus TaxID=569882 RepID=A0A1H8QHS7_9RHOB|nr:SPOR domain-containing protein [Salinihabitans flavidus]SEO53477.1 Sporulation related domain-containing protein [Salinihabitans flavidus]
MADFPMTGAQEAPSQSRSIASLANWAGAAVSLALIFGAGVWGYKLLVRDVTGVPVVRAVEGPMRVQPDDPGGRPAEHQGLAVNNVAAEGVAAAPADRLVLAPQPIRLADEDVPVTQVKAEIIEDAEDGPAEANEPITAPEPLNGGRAASIEALAEQIAAGAAKLSTSAKASPVADSSDSDSSTATAEEAESEPEATVAGGLGVSLRPKLRPEGVQLASAASMSGGADALPADTVDEVDPASITVGTRLVQLGAFASPEIAREQWDKLQGRFATVLDGKKRVIQKATSGGRVFYRLRAMGFDDLSDARRMCSALKAENADCIPVVTR